MMMAFAGEPDPAGRPDLFRELMTPARARRAPFAAPVSLVVHAVALSLVIAVSLARLESPPLKRDIVHIPLYGPPPAPPLPLPKGNGSVEPVRAHVVVATTPAFTAPVERAPVEPAPATVEEPADASGSPLGA